ncbi:MAG: YHYH protein [Thermodesulfobacteriota bacterium]
MIRINALLTLFFLFMTSFSLADNEDCPAVNFLNLSEYQQSNIDQVPASDQVFCEGNYLIVKSNGMPTYKAERITPNSISAQNYHWKIPLNPKIADTPSEIPYLGPVAVTITGIPIYSPNEAGDLGYGDAKLDDILDSCGGHIGPNGSYHFHARPECPFSTAQDLASSILGYSFDGFPIMAPYVCIDQQCNDLRKVKGSWQECKDDKCKKTNFKILDSSWELIDPSIKSAWEKFEFVEGSGDLDKCNGMFGADGKYRYYATDTFPYNLGCYKGVIDRDLNNLRPGWSDRASFNEPRLGTNSGQRPPGGQRGNSSSMRGHPDLGVAANRLGIPENELRRALGPPPPDLQQAAQELGISVNELRDALHNQ